VKRYDPSMTDRIAGFLQRLDQLNVDDLEVLALEPIPVADRDRLLSDADAAAQAAGRLDELDEAADLAKETVVRALSLRSFDPTWLGVNWGRTLGHVEDRAELIAEIEEGAMAAVVADVAPAVADRLGARFERLAAMTGTAWEPNPRSDRQRNAVRVLWLGGAIAVVATTVAVLVELAAESTPGYFF